MEDLRIAAVQMNSAVGKIEDSLSSMRKWIETASEQNVDLICFPEMCITGYAMPQSIEFSETMDGDSVKRILEMSEEFSMSIAAGLSEKADDGSYITQFLAEDGVIAGKYRKTHLGEREKLYYRAGNDIEVIKCKNAKIGFQLCWESHFPEISSILALDGADIILMPHSSGLPSGRRKEIWDKCLKARAYDNTVYVIACNQLGDNGLGTVFGGGCTAVDPRGNILTEDYGSKDSMIIAYITSEILDKLRRIEYTSMKDLYYLNRRRPELYGRITETESQ